MTTISRFWHMGMSFVMAYLAAKGYNTQDTLLLAFCITGWGYSVIHYIETGVYMRKQ